MRAARGALFAFCLAWAALFLAQKINLTTADIGRHLQNGRNAAAWLSSPSDGEGARVFSRNLYSYTHPDFPAMNHHWGSGLVFYLVRRAFGFEGLSVFYLTLLLSAWTLMLRLAVRRGGWGWAIAWALWLVPVFAGRREVRPEAFSVFFAACFVYFFEHYSDGRISTRRLAAVLGALQILWTNLHIYFVLGPLIAALYALVSKNRSRAALVFLCVSAAALVNPFGPRGALYPLFIFGNYGYRIVENQSIPFLERLHVVLPNFVFFKISTTALAAAALLRRRVPDPATLLALLFAAAGWRAIRNFQLFALFGLPALAAGCAASAEFGKRLPGVFKKAVAGLGTAAALAAALFVYRGHPIRPMWGTGIGLLPGVSASAEFFREENLKGPIFNNYDIGGYLIYELWPEEKVFVDNRPEAYPEAFLRGAVVAAQENEERWRMLDAEYRFNAIFFGHRDLTPWAQAFLIRRLNDPDWAPVFADDYAVVFLRRSVENISVIVRRELPKSAFRVISNP